ncbi:CIA30 family protein [Cohnella candidum]|uniref:CIA30 family protein n=1 Tax=Cohnella candidum TaxID=2674991 RepID=UPI0013DE6A31|nr:CIA30 family protein [Cohnella candidum]
MKTKGWLVTLLALALGFQTFAAAETASANKAEAKSAFKTFITVKGDKLMDGNKEFRFGSINYPGAIRDPAFSQEDALRTIAAMGGKVTRTYVLPVKRYDNAVKDPLVLGPDAKGIMQFNEQGFKNLDRFLALANRYGIRVILPFVDQWQWEGGIESYVNFRYPGTITNDAANDEDAWKFYTDPQVISDFKQVVKYTMNRVNTVTGVKYKDDPAILAWETGNELGGYNQDKFPQSWTTEIAAYIRSQKPKQLVMDGRFAIQPESLANKDIDVVSDHFYTGNFLERVNADREASKGKKPYILGEFGLYTDAKDVDALYKAALTNGTSGIIIWSLRPHKPDGGFYWHDESPGNWSAYHWPGFSSGDWYDETDIIQTVYKYAHYMSANDKAQKTKVPAIPAPANAPVLLPFDSVADIRWQGSVGASGYEIQRSKDGKKWETVATGVSDGGRAGTRAFHDEKAVTGTTYFYRIRGTNESGVSPWSNVIRTKARHIIKDEMSLLYDDKENRDIYAYDHSSNVQSGSASPNELGIGYQAYVATADSGYVTYASKVPLNSLKVIATGSGTPTFLVSDRDDGYQPVDAGKIAKSTENGQTVYKIGELPLNTRFVKLIIPGKSALRVDRVELEYVFSGNGYQEVQAPVRSGFLVDSEAAGKTGSLIYRTGGDINSYRLTASTRSATTEGLFRFEVSIDGLTYKEVQPTLDTRAGEGGETTLIYSDFAVPASSRYLKITAPAASEAKLIQTAIGYGKDMLPVTDRPPVNTLENGEYYFGDNGLIREAYTRDGNGGAISISVDPANKLHGSYGVSLDYSLSQAGYAGLTRNLGGADLSAFDALHAWVKPDGSGNTLTFRFRTADDRVWETGVKLTGTEGRTIEIPFSAFKQPASDTQAATAMDMKAVKAFSYYVRSAEGASTAAGKIGLDDVNAANAAKIDNFESYGGYDALLKMAYGRNAGGGTFDMALDRTNKSEGQYGLKLTYDITSAGYAGATLKPDFLNLKGFDGFTMWFKPDGSGNKLVIQFTTEDGQFWETSGLIRGTDAKLLYVPFSAFRHPEWYGGDRNATPDLTKNITGFSIYINSNPDTTKKTASTVYIDDINGVVYSDDLASKTVSLAEMGPAEPVGDQPLPDLGKNYLLNPGFEDVVDANAWPVLPKEWTHKDANGKDITDGTVKLEGSPRTGAYKLVHYSAGPYEATSSQTVTGLPDGTYELTAWTKSKFGNPQLAEMTVSGYGGAPVSEKIEEGEGSWVLQKISGIQVSGGSLTVSFHSRNVQNDFWIAVDDVKLVKVENGIE